MALDIWHPSRYDCYMVNNMNQTIPNPNDCPEWMTHDEWAAIWREIQHKDEY